MATLLSVTWNAEFEHRNEILGTTKGTKTECCDYFLFRLQQHAFCRDNVVCVVQKIWLIGSIVQIVLKIPPKSKCSSTIWPMLLSGSAFFRCQQLATNLCVSVLSYSDLKCNTFTDHWTNLLLVARILVVLPLFFDTYVFHWVALNCRLLWKASSRVRCPVGFWLDY